MILISACLVGKRCRFDGGGYEGYPDLVELVEGGFAVPLCPEMLGGLPTPRPPVELVGGDGISVLRGAARVLRIDGLDLTEAFVKGANAALRIALESRGRLAILKARSPSCGSGSIHDGNFQGALIPGLGVTAALFTAEGIEVCDEENYKERVLEISASRLPQRMGFET